MLSQIQVFQCPKKPQWTVRGLNYDAQPYILAKDIADIAGISRLAQAVTTIPRTEMEILDSSITGLVSTAAFFLTEEGFREFMNLANMSREDAATLKLWISLTVFPSLVLDSAIEARANRDSDIKNIEKRLKKLETAMNCNKDLFEIIIDAIMRGIDRWENKVR